MILYQVIILSLSLGVSPIIILFILTLFLAAILFRRFSLGATHYINFNFNLLSESLLLDEIRSNEVVNSVIIGYLYEGSIELLVGRVTVRIVHFQALKRFLEVFNKVTAKLANIGHCNCDSNSQWFGGQSQNPIFGFHKSLDLVNMFLCFGFKGNYTTFRIALNLKLFKFAYFLSKIVTAFSNRLILGYQTLHSLQSQGHPGTYYWGSRFGALESRSAIDTSHPLWEVRKRGLLPQVISKENHRTTLGSLTILMRIDCYHLNLLQSKVTRLKSVIFQMC